MPRRSTEIQQNKADDGKKFKLRKVFDSSQIRY